jgi:hypothetical protein
MNYMVNPQTGKVELGQSIMGHFIPATQLNPSLYAPKPMMQQQPSMINRNQQPYQYNAPTAAQMFGGMQAPMQTPFSGMFGGMPSPNMGAMTPTMGMPSFNMSGQGGGQFGAGRFLGGNTGLLGGNSTSMLGT